MYLLINSVNQNNLFLVLLEKDKVFKKTKNKLNFSEGEKILKLVDNFLQKNKVNKNNLKGLIINTGPGSFTSLRLAILLANTWSYVNKIPLYGFKDKDFDIKNIIKKIKTKKSTKFLEPYYGKEPNITKAKK